MSMSQVRIKRASFFLSMIQPFHLFYFISVILATFQQFACKECNSHSQLVLIKETIYGN